MQKHHKTFLFSVRRILLTTPEGEVILDRDLRAFWNQPLRKWNCSQELLMFLHIPKSGGTSFRASLVNALKESNHSMDCLKVRAKLIRKYPVVVLIKNYRWVPFFTNVDNPNSQLIWKRHGAFVPDFPALNLILNSKFAQIKGFFWCYFFELSRKYLYSVQKSEWLSLNSSTKATAFQDALDDWIHPYMYRRNWPNSGPNLPLFPRFFMFCQQVKCENWPFGNFLWEYWHPQNLEPSKHIRQFKHQT